MYVFEKHLKRRSGSTTESVWNSKLLKKWTPATGTVDVGTYPQRDTQTESWYCGWDIPDYYRRVRKGELMPFTPWRKATYSGSSTGAYDVWSGGGTSHWWSPDSWNTFSDWVITAEDLWSYAPESYDKYVNEAAAKIYSSGYDALTALAELTELRRLFSISLRKLLKLKIPSSWSRRSLAIGKALASDWLSARYGWRTLVYDILQINELIANWNEKRTRYSEKCGTKWTHTATSYDTIEKTHYFLDQLVHDVVEVSIRGSVVADIEVPKVQFNPLQTGWELIPLSFVVDWFFTVGKALSAGSFLAYQKRYSAAKGFKVKVTRTFTSNIGSTKPTFDSGVDEQIGDCVAELEERRPCRVPLAPHLTLRLNTFKIVDLLGLLTQRVIRR